LKAFSYANAHVDVVKAIICECLQCQEVHAFLLCLLCSSIWHDIWIFWFRQFFVAAFD